MIYLSIALGIIALALIAVIWDKLEELDRKVETIIDSQLLHAKSIGDIDTEQRSVNSIMLAHKKQLDSQITTLKQYEERTDKINLQVNELSKEIAKEDNSLYNESYGDPEVIDFMDQMYLNKEGKLK